jgi:NADH-quinone oxidoreductase subunit L
MTHAFFKALLFLGAGSVIHAMSDEQDIRKMGGIWRLIPITYAMMWIGSLALAGIPFFAGYYSKDMILEAAYAAHTGVGAYAFWLGIAAALMTAFYSWRLIILTFHGRPRANDRVMAHVHESPAIMTVPLAVLAVGALFSGMVAYNWFVGEGREAFWGEAIFVLHEHDTIEAAHHVPSWVPMAPFIAGVIGIALAYLFYMFVPQLPGMVTGALGGLYRFVYRKWMFDELYDRLFVQPARYLGYGLWKSGDGAIIDGVGPDGIAAATRDVAFRAARLQSGYVYHYAFVMVIGVVLLVGWFYFFG